MSVEGKSFDQKALAELLERVERASGPDASIDEAVAKIFGTLKGSYYACGDCGDGGWLCFKDGKMFWSYHSYPDGLKFDSAEDALRVGATVTATRTVHPPKPGTLRAVFEPDYPRSSAPITASIDAAVALVEKMLPDWHWNTGDETRDGLGIWLSCAKEETPALAIIAALLRALSSPDQGTRG